MWFDWNCAVQFSLQLSQEAFHCRFCRRSLLKEIIDESLIDRIPGRQNDRKTLLGELNWIFTAVTDTIAWNVLPHGISLNFCIMYQGQTSLI